MGSYSAFAAASISSNIHYSFNNVIFRIRFFRSKHYSGKFVYGEYRCVTRKKYHTESLTRGVRERSVIRIAYLFRHSVMDVSHERVSDH